MVLFMSVSLFICYPAMAASNSDTISSITTKQGIGMGSVAFSDVILLKGLLTKHEKVMVIFTKKCGDTHTFGQRYQQVGNRVMNKVYGRLHASSSLVSYRRLEQAKLN